MKRYQCLRRFSAAAGQLAATLLAAGLAATLLAAAPLAAANVAPPQIAPQALEQIRLVLEQKANLTDVQRKIDFHLLIAVQMQRGALPPSLSFLRADPQLRRDEVGRELVDVQAQVTQALLASIRQLGGEIVGSSPSFGSVRAWLPPAEMEALAGLAAVRFIRPASAPVGRAAASREAAADVLDDVAGDVAHRADQARQVFQVDGTGHTVGVLSDGVNSLAALQQSGVLPEVTVLPGQAGGSASEGTAMLEIVHRLAPGARLFFATGFNGEASFAENILALRDAGCDILVDDISYRTSPVFQDGAAAQAVRQVTEAGVAYFSSAGNVGNLTHGKAGVWEGDFAESGQRIPRVSGIVHRFGTSISNGVLGAATVTLQWSDPFGASSNDYDVCVLDAKLSKVFDCSANVQDGHGDPFEQVQTFDAGERLVIVKAASAAPRFLDLNVHQFGLLEITTDGQVYGQPAVEGAFAVAAVDVATAHGGPFPGGVTNPVEVYSSDGPRRIFFDPQGAPITPGNFLATGGKLILKPDLAAADKVTVLTPGFNPFAGTSAAAPHAAAIAALVLEQSPGLTPAQLREALTSTALDIEQLGPDRNSGAGIVDALAAVRKGFSLTPLPVCPDATPPLQLQGGRFAATLAWRLTERGLQGCGQPIPISSQAGVYWFFDPSLPEVLAKEIDGCAVNGRHWIFVAGATDADYELSVQDRTTGQIRVFRHAGGGLPLTLADTAGFPGCP
jgi:subtilisin family serine protease